MLVSHAKQFIFLKTSKTAGTSVEGYFERYCLSEAEREAYVSSHQTEAHIGAVGVIGERTRSKRNAGRALSSHVRAKGILNLVGEEIWRRYFKFTVVRNPYDKVVSLFIWRLRKTEDIGALSFGELKAKFQSSILDDPSFPKDRPYANVSGKRQIDVDYLIRFEALYDGVKAVTGKLGVPFEPERLPEYKKGARTSLPHWSAFYDADSLDVVTSAYAWEFDVLGYERCDTPASAAEAQTAS